MKKFVQLMQYFNFLRNPWRYFPVQLVVKKDGSFVCNHRQTREAKANAEIPLQWKWRHCKKAIATNYLQREVVITAFQSASWIIPSVIVTTSQTRWVLRTQGIFPGTKNNYYWIWLSKCCQAVLVISSTFNKMQKRFLRKHKQSTAFLLIYLITDISKNWFIKCFLKNVFKIDIS